MLGADVAAKAIQSDAPPRPPDSVTVTFEPVAADVVLTESVGAVTIENVNDPDVPPPGGGVVTDTCAVPCAATSASPIAARSCVLLMNVVGRGLPFQLTTELAAKPEPFTVREKPPEPATVLDGDSVLATGAGAVAAVTVTAGLVAARV